MSTEPQTHTLSLKFDAKQITQVLMYEFICDDKPSPSVPLGAYAGTHILKKGDKLNILMTATSLIDPEPSPLDPEAQYRVDKIDFMSLDIISLPNVNTLIPGALSPFENASASQSIDHTGFSEVVVTGTEDKKEYQTHILSPLEVVADDGFWKLSAYLSVIVHATDLKADVQHAFPRVFTFDPEVTGGRQDP